MNRLNADPISRAMLNTAMLNGLTKTIEQHLRTVIVLSRDGGELSTNEQHHAARWSRIVVALMDQAKARAAAEAMDATMSQILTAIASDVKAFDEDHSCGHLTVQACDRFVRQVEGINVPLQLNLAMVRGLGVPEVV